MSEFAATAVLERNINVAVQLCGPCEECPEPELPFILVWDTISSASSYVNDINNVADWNTFGSWDFTSVAIIGNAVLLYGSAGIVIAANTFKNNSNLVQVIDQAEVCTEVME